jgi:hypothetical protein
LGHTDISANLEQFIPENAFGWDYDAISASLCSCYANKKEAQKSEARNEP